MMNQSQIQSNFKFETNRKLKNLRDIYLWNQKLSANITNNKENLLKT